MMCYQFKEGKYFSVTEFTSLMAVYKSYLNDINKDDGILCFIVWMLFIQKASEIGKYVNEVWREKTE